LADRLANSGAEGRVCSCSKRWANRHQTFPKPGTLLAASAGGLPVADSQASEASQDSQATVSSIWLANPAAVSLMSQASQAASPSSQTGSTPRLENRHQTVPKPCVLTGFVSGGFLAGSAPVAVSKSPEASEDSQATVSMSCMADYRAAPHSSQSQSTPPLPLDSQADSVVDLPLASQQASQEERPFKRPRSTF